MSGNHVEAEQAVLPQLRDGERLEWSGRPRTGVRLTRADIFLIPFSLLWGGFAIFWESAVVSGGGGIFFELWGVPFVLVGLYMIVGRFFYRAWLSERTVYAVTDRRILRLAGRRVDSMYLSAIPDVSTSVGSSGRGDVLFGRSASAWYGGIGMPFRGSVGGPALAFYDVDDPAAVAELVDRVRTQR